VGEGAVDAIVEIRATGPFIDLFDFCDRVDLKRCNKKVLEALIKSGAFDALGENRATLMERLEAAVERAQRQQKERQSGQTSLFGDLAPAPPVLEQAAPSRVVGTTAPTPLIEEWPPRLKLAFEKESLGFYISGHPLDRYRADLLRFKATPTADLSETPDRTEVSVGGVVVDYRDRPLKSGTGRMGFFKLEDHTGQIEVVCFSKAFAEYEEVLRSDEPLLITGNLAIEGEGENSARKIHLREAVPLARLRADRTRAMALSVNADELTADRARTLKQTLERYHGSVPTTLRLVVPLRSRTEVVLPARYAVAPTDDLLLALERILGPKAVELR